MILNIFTMMMRNVFSVKHLESLLVDGEDGHWCCTFCLSPACHTVCQTGCDHCINVQFCSCVQCCMFLKLDNLYLAVKKATQPTPAYF